MIKLGLIGEGIGRSRMPELQHLAAKRAGLALSYQLIDLDGAGPDAFERTLRACAEEGFRGVNVTHPFKERVVPLVRIDDPRVQAMGAVNTVIFDSSGVALGHNTDYSGAVRSFRQCLGERPIGTVAIIGTGGVGRAIAFALGQLGAAALRLFDLDRAKAEAVRRAVRSAWPGMAVEIADTAAAAARGADGVVNGTPIGMAGRPGVPLPEAVLGDQHWAFDAVYTPESTAFLQAARRQGLTVLSGFRLFLGQGADAFQLFTGARLDETAIAALERELRSQSGSDPD
jgi:shikimate dehydrogenase